MLETLFPRRHRRLSALPLLGPYAEGFAQWLLEGGYPRLPVRLRLRQLPRVEGLVRDLGVGAVTDLTAAALLALAPKDSQDDIELAAVIRSLVRYLSSIDQLVHAVPTARERLVDAYVSHVRDVRGLANSTCVQHAATASEWLSFLGFDGDDGVLRAVGTDQIQAFLRLVGPRQSRASLQHIVAQLRSFLRFLAGRGLAPSGLDTQIDTPRVYRGERLPRALPWETVLAFLQAIDRSTPMGRRDYAMFVLITTYGLRTCEVTELRLDDVHWRARELHVPRSKTRSPLVLPLTDNVGAALIAYLQDGRPALPHREVFLRARAPTGTLHPAAVTDAFQRWVRHSGLRIPYQGAHCLRHSLAVHLLREGTALKTIGDLLGHRDAESTCVYLRLHVEDLREVALDLPEVAQ
jgi:integrase/recombinase XerD